MGFGKPGILLSSYIVVAERIDEFLMVNCGQAVNRSASAAASTETDVGWCGYSCFQNALDHGVNDGWMDGWIDTEIDAIIHYYVLEFVYFNVLQFCVSGEPDLGIDWDRCCAIEFISLNAAQLMFSTTYWF